MNIETKLEEILTKLDAQDEILNRLKDIIAGYPKAYKLYKGVTGKNGAIQLDLTPIYHSARDLGVVFLQAAAAIGPNEYDWDNKITMALNLADIATILNTFRSPPAPGTEGVKLFHDKYKGTEREKEVTTTLKIARGDQYGFFFSLSRNENNQNRFVSIPVSDGEAIQIRVLLEQAVKQILGW
jgi:hypothetical protein